jgi:hypothetical protein
MVPSLHAPASDTLFGFHPEDRAARHHLDEVVRCLPPASFEALMADLDRAENGGALGEVIGDVLRRAACLADAERISARFGFN